MNKKVPWIFGNKLTKQTLGTYRLLTEAIFEIDLKIRHVAILGTNGERIEGGYRNNVVEKYYTNDELNELAQFYRWVWNTREFHRPRVGELCCLTLEFDKVIKMVFPLGEDRIITISSEKRIPFTVPLEIKKKLKSWNDKKKTLETVFVI